jgi:hypothetical protein
VDVGSLLTLLPEHLFRFSEIAGALKVAEVTWKVVGYAAPRLRDCFRQIISRGAKFSNLTVDECMDRVANRKNEVICVTNISGVLTPYVQLHRQYTESFVQMARMTSTVRHTSPAPELRSLDYHQWFGYGPSLQSTLRSGTQIFQLATVEEVKSFPVVLSEKYWRSLGSPFQLPEHGPYRLEQGFGATVSGALLAIDSPLVRDIVGLERGSELKTSGYLRVLIPDADFINTLNLDLRSVTPGIALSRNPEEYFAYVWAIYDDADGHLWPIYEYGNVASPRFYELLVTLLLERIAAYKRYVWKDHRKRPGDRQYRLLATVNDEIGERIADRFGDVPPPQGRIQLLEFLRGSR